jgi:hypothetical protein
MVPAAVSVFAGSGGENHLATRHRNVVPASIVIAEPTPMVPFGA